MHEYYDDFRLFCIQLSMCEHSSAQILDITFQMTFVSHFPKIQKKITVWGPPRTPDLYRAWARHELKQLVKWRSWLECCSKESAVWSSIYKCVFLIDSASCWCWGFFLARFSCWTSVEDSRESNIGNLSFPAILKSSFQRTRSRTTQTEPNSDPFSI